MRKKKISDAIEANVFIIGSVIKLIMQSDNGSISQIGLISNSIGFIKLNILFYFII